jgi:CRISPR system Cascade subunit CasC
MSDQISTISTELTSGLFYGYVVVDVPLLISNLAGDPDLAAKVVEHLIHLVAAVSPGAKKGSTAPYSYAELLLVELGRRQPRSLASAFRKPIPLAGSGAEGYDVAAAAHEALSVHIERFDASYGAAEERLLLSRLGETLPGAGAPQTLDDVAARAAAAVREREAPAGLNNATVPALAP